MREMKFRGKKIDADKWVYGSGIVIVDKGYMAIPLTKDVTEDDYAITLCKIHVGTQGQYTGFDTGNGEIWEGDIVNYVKGSPKEYVRCVVCYGEYETYTHVNDGGENIGDVEQHVGFYIQPIKEWKEKSNSDKIPLRSLWIEKIGNIHENSELLNQ